MIFSLALVPVYGHLSKRSIISNKVSGMVAVWKSSRYSLFEWKDFRCHVVRHVELRAGGCRHVNADCRIFGSSFVSLMLRLLLSGVNKVTSWWRKVDRNPG